MASSGVLARSWQVARSSANAGMISMLPASSPERNVTQGRKVASLKNAAERPSCHRRLSINWWGSPYHFSPAKDAVHQFGFR